jgi:hypothetical protein
VNEVTAMIAVVESKQPLFETLVRTNKDAQAQHDNTGWPTIVVRDALLVPEERSGVLSCCELNHIMYCVHPLDICFIPDRSGQILWKLKLFWPW